MRQIGVLLLSLFSLQAGARAYRDTLNGATVKVCNAEKACAELLMQKAERSSFSNLYTFAAAKVTLSGYRSRTVGNEVEGEGYYNPKLGTIVVKNYALKKQFIIDTEKGIALSMPEK